jgi:hypothetical protein
MVPITATVRRRGIRSSYKDWNESLVTSLGLKSVKYGDSSHPPLLPWYHFTDEADSPFFKHRILRMLPIPRIHCQHNEIDEND